MKFVKSILPVLCILVGVSVASPIAAPEPVPSTATENYPGDGSPAAWALLREAESRRTSPNEDAPVAIFERGIEKRDSWNCAGSSSCGLVSGTYCSKATNLLDDNTWYTWYVARTWVSCTAFYLCNEGSDYGGGWPGWFLKDKMRSIYSSGGCTRCGSCYFWASCRVTYNYCNPCSNSG